MKHRLRPIAFLIIIYTVLIYFLIFHFDNLKNIVTENYFSPNTIFNETEKYLKNNFINHKQLIKAKYNIQYILGKKEFNGVFYNNNRYLEKLNIDETYSTQSKNINTIKEFANKYKKRATIVLIPTAPAIYQEELPIFANANQINQRELTEKIYKRLGDDITGIDVYPQLFSKKKNDIFYKTDTSLTMYAHYLIYNTLSYRLNYTAYGLENFTKSEVGLDFYGNLYNNILYNSIPPDKVYYYHKNTPVNVIVENWNNNENKTYYTLFPQEATISQNPNDIVLGGNGLYINIKNNSQNVINRNLMVIGDNNTTKLLPFLALHYSNISFWNLQNENEILQKINSNKFDETLIIFSLDTFLNNPLYEKMKFLI